MIGTLKPSRFALVAVFLSMMVGTSAARAADLLSGMTPIGSNTLGKVNTVQDNLFNTSQVSNTATTSGNTITHSQVTNGAIQNNTIANNSGVTAVMMNTGNNVNFNNAMIVNVIVPH